MKDAERIAELEAALRRSELLVEQLQAQLNLRRKQRPPVGEREAFEDYCRELGYTLKVGDSGRYLGEYGAELWAGFKAGAAWQRAQGAVPEGWKLAVDAVAGYAHLYNSGSGIIHEIRAEHARLLAAAPATSAAQAAVPHPLRYTNDGELAECPCCGSLDVGGAHDTVNCYGCGLQITKPRPLQNAVDAWNKRAMLAAAPAHPAERQEQEEVQRLADDRDQLRAMLAATEEGEV